MTNLNDNSENRNWFGTGAILFYTNDIQYILDYQRCLYYATMGYKSPRFRESQLIKFY